MRRLAPLALLALLLVPATAKADGLPGTAGYAYYPLTGCTWGGDLCVTTQTYDITDGRRWTEYSCTWAYGSCSTGSVGTEGFLYGADGTLIQRISSIPHEAAPGSVPVFGVITRGVVTLGDGESQISARYEPVLVTTPEPGTFVLLGSGLAAIAAARRRRQLVGSRPTIT